MQTTDFKSKLLLWILLLPALLHGVLAAYAAIVNGYMPFGRFDCVIYLLIFVYLTAILMLRKDFAKLTNLALLIYSILISILIFEAVIRFVKKSDYLPWEPMRRVSDAAQGVMPGIEGKIEFSVNRYGVRGRETSLDEEIRILVIGGSTAECLYVTDHASWPWQLEEKLARRTGKSVFVGNSGKAGAFTVDHLHLLKNYHHINQFKTILVLSGVNDLGAFLRGTYEERKRQAAASDFVPIYYQHLRLYKILKRALPLDLNNPNIAYQDPEGLWYEEERRIRKAATKRTSIPNGFEDALTEYGINLREMVTIAKARGQQIIFLTQPSMWQASMDPLFRKFIMGAYFRL